MTRGFFYYFWLMIDRETVDRILDAADIVDVISDFVTLRRRGANYIACCPFHNEKTPSFSVSPSKGIFKCFLSLRARVYSSASDAARPAVP